MNGLDNIIMGDEEDPVLRNKFCSFPKYGHFVVVFNRMQGNATDDELYRDLMMTEADSPDRNDIRKKMNECFDGISVHGLPDLGPGQLDYSILNERFKTGLASMANTILEKAPTPRNITVGSLELELNSNTAEILISLVIRKANEGKIDMTCGSNEGSIN